MTITTNENRLIQLSLQGLISHPSQAGYLVDRTGRPRILPGIGGITYNLRLGDPAYGWAGDHVEPEVSLWNPNKADSEALNILACIGNEVTVTQGDAKGEKGYVIGRHSGAEHVMIHFPNSTALDHMMVGDSMLIRAWGQGIVVAGYEDMVINCLDPRLLNKIVKIGQGDCLEVPVVAEIPGLFMGSGIGMHSYRGDYDIMSSDEETARKQGFDQLRLGDLVLLQDCWNDFGRGRLQGAVSIGVIVHSDCVLAGHGPGVVNVLSSKSGKIEGRLDPEANLIHYMDWIESHE